jgi:plasmid stabilization system protein ParE
LKVVYRPLVQRDIDEASRWYEEKSPGLSDEFLATFERILVHPTAFSLETHSGRRFANFRRFPYKIIFREVRAETVKVLVVRHQKRHPDFGSRRR